MLADFYNEQTINDSSYPINGVKDYQIKYCESYDEYFSEIENVP